MAQLASLARLSAGRDTTDPTSRANPTNQPPQGAKRRRYAVDSDDDDDYLYPNPATSSTTFVSRKRKPILAEAQTEGISVARPARSTRRPVQYRVDDDNLSASDDYAAWQSTDSDEEEDRRIARSMGVIRKSLNRGSAGGVKVHCDVCSVDVTSTVRISCSDPACHEYDLCVPCFSAGETSRNHDPRSHRYQVVEQNSIPIYDEDWGADEELLLIEGAEIYGLGSWADIADHVGGFRTKDEVRDHYSATYVNSSLFPLPERADPTDKRLLERVPKEEFQARKKRRIEERKEAAKSAPPATPKQKPTASVPACHEVQGFMPGRLEFENEFANEAEEAVQHMQFEPGDGLDANGQMDEETLLKMTVFDIYNSRLADRTNRKRIIFEHQLLEYRKNNASDKKRTKEERELFNKCKPFARMMNHDDFKKLSDDLIYEHNLRAAIAQLQSWRNLGIADLREGDKYEQDKNTRSQRNQPQGQFDRMASSISGRQKPGPKDAPETPSEAQKLVSTQLPIRFQSNPKEQTQTPAIPNEFDKLFAETNGGLSPLQQQQAKPRVKYLIQPLNGITPWKLEEGEPAASDTQILSAEEIQLCNVLHFYPKAYNAIKLGLTSEAMKQGGSLKRKEAKAICKLDPNKANRLYDFMIHSGWISKA